MGECAQERWYKITGAEHGTFEEPGGSDSLSMPTRAD